jgi:hypothetical protein
VTGAGDVDGDGFHDVLVGAAGFDHARGAAFLFPGSAGGTVRLPSWRAFGPWRDSGFGSAIAAGDVNGDGHRDVLIGAPDAGPARRGAAFAYHGSASGLPEFPSTTFSPPGGHDGYDNGNSDWGTSLCLADMNGDGFDDALIDNPTHDTNLGHGSGVYPDSGILVIHRGTPAGIGPFAGGFSGITRSCAPVGDLNADGRDDVSIQLTTYDFVATYFALVVYGSSQRVPIESKICTGGDVDGDGVDDLVASDPAFDAGKGIVRIHRGVAGALISSTETWTLTAP